MRAKGAEYESQLVTNMQVRTPPISDTIELAMKCKPWPVFHRLVKCALAGHAYLPTLIIERNQLLGVGLCRNQNAAYQPVDRLCAFNPFQTIVDYSHLDSVCLVPPIAF